MSTLEAPAITPAKTIWPKGSDLERFYGKIEFGYEGDPTDRWEARALQHLPLPFSLRLAWRPEQSIRRIRVNRNCLRSLSRVFDAIHKMREEFGPALLPDVDIFGGCYIPLSRAAFGVLGPHSYGSAIRVGNGELPRKVTAAFETEGWKAIGSNTGTFAAIS
jgi:hypothetical protein